MLDAEAVKWHVQNMQIQEVALTVTGLAAAARFYRDVLDLPVAQQPGHVTVMIGSSRLVLGPYPRLVDTGCDYSAFVSVAVWAVS